VTDGREYGADEAMTESLFDRAQQQRIAQAIAGAERATSGEIVAVIARESDSYTFAPILWAALAALLVPWPLVFFTWIPVQWIYVVQLFAFAGLVAALWPRAIRLRLVPQAIKRARARRRAVEQFLVQNLHTTEGRTGVLIFVSLAERHVEILADRGIDAKVPSGTWQAIVDDFVARLGADQPVEGFVQAITAVGGLLARHFPPGSIDHNELPNHLIVLTSE
jgi:putative membrane protein